MRSDDSGKPRELTAKQKRFVEEYCVARRRARAATGAMFNGTAAAIAAGYSQRSARQMATENLSKPSIRAAIDARLEELSEASRMKAGEVLDIMSELARLPILDEKDRVQDVAGARVVISALELLAKYHKLLTDRHEIGGMDGRPIAFALPRMADSEPTGLPEELK